MTLTVAEIESHGPGGADGRLVGSVPVARTQGAEPALPAALSGFRSSGAPVRRTAERFLADLDRQADGKAARPDATLKPGGRLLREWNGVTHTVEVTDEGFRWNGQTYRSLSAVARAITGARWSGPRFFGLQEGAR